MSLEFCRRPTQKFGISVALYGYKLAFHHPLVRWKYMSSGYCTKLVTEHCSIICIVLCGTTFTLLKKRCQCFVDAPMLRSHRRQRPLTDNKEKPQPHSDHLTGAPNHRDNNFCVNNKVIRTDRCFLTHPHSHTDRHTCPDA